MARFKYMTACILLLSGFAWGADPREPGVRLQVSPRMSLALPGSLSPIRLTAQIVGPETEEYYCPEVVWVWPNGTRSSEESDCAPFESREHYPRRFTRRIAARPFPRDYVVCVELRKGDEMIDRSCARYAVR